MILTTIERGIALTNKSWHSYVGVSMSYVGDTTYDLLFPTYEIMSPT